MITFFLAAFAFGSPVTISGNSVLLKDVVKEISAHSDAPLACDSKIANEQVMISVTDVSTDALKAKLAEATSTQWAMVDGKDTLTRSVAYRRKLAEDENALCEKRINSWISSYAGLQDVPTEAVKKMMASPAFNRGDSGIDANRELDGSNFATVSAKKLLAALGARSLTKMRVSERRVYSDHPNQIQLAIPTKQLALISNLKQSIVVMRDELLARPMAKRDYVTYDGLPKLDLEEAKKSYGRTLISIQRIEPLNFEIKTIVRSQENTKILESYFRLNSIYNLVQVPPDPNPEPIELTGVAKDFVAMSRTLGSGTAEEVTYNDERGDFQRVMYWTKPIDAGLEDPIKDFRGVIRDPLKYDPVGEVYGPFFDDQAKDEHRNLIATMADTSKLFFINRLLSFDMIPSRKSLLAMLEALNSPEEFRVPEIITNRSEGWMVVKPYLPSTALSIKIDRSALKQLISQVAKNQSLSIEDASAYFRVAGAVPAIRGVDFWSLSNAIPEVDGTDTALMFTPAYPLLASLAPGQWNAAEAGNLRFKDLLPNQKELLRKFVYEYPQFKRYIPSQSATSADEYLRTEPTDLLPQGIPADALIRIEQLVTPAVRAMTSNRTTYTMSAAELAGSDSKDATSGRVYVGFLPASRTVYRVTISLSPDWPVTLNCQETLVNSGGKYGPRKDLSPAFLKDVQRIRGLIDAGG